MIKVECDYRQDSLISKDQYFCKISRWYCVPTWCLKGNICKWKLNIDRSNMEH